MKERIAIDMDEVMADTLAKHLACYKRDFGETLTKADLAGHRLDAFVPAERREHVRGYLRINGYFRDIPVMSGSQEVIRALAKRYEIFVASAAMEFPTSFTDKYEWLHEHFPFIPYTHIVFCGDKSILAADFLIDDNVHQLTRFNGQGILYTSPSNLQETRFPRVNDWSEVRQRFL